MLGLLYGILPIGWGDDKVDSKKSQILPKTLPILIESLLIGILSKCGTFFCLGKPRKLSGLAYLPSLVEGFSIPQLRAWLDSN